MKFKKNNYLESKICDEVDEYLSQYNEKTGNCDEGVKPTHRNKEIKIKQSQEKNDKSIDSDETYNLLPVDDFTKSTTSVKKEARNKNILIPDVKPKPEAKSKPKPKPEPKSDLHSIKK